jgi:hypothetical protein
LTLKARNKFSVVKNSSIFGEKLTYVKMRVLALLVFFFYLQDAVAQSELIALTIPENLKENANAVIRLDKTDITISSRKSMNIKKHRIVTILNEKGLYYMQAGEVFDNSTNIKSIEAIIYDSLGKEIKKIKKKDFHESSVSEGSIITDNKLIELNYIPVAYPFTIEYNSDVQTSNTAFIPSWSPVEGLFSAIERAEINITCAPELGFRYKEYNFNNFGIIKQEIAGGVSYTASALAAIKKEDYLPSLHKIIPNVMFGIEKFHLEGVDAEVNSWQNFGTWLHNNLLKGTDVLAPATVAAIKAKVGTETDPMKKAQIVYEYVQSKTRYISIQLGIGGWRPMLAKDVDRLGYGDCKALTNYTRALLAAVGVESYYTVVYAGSDRKDMKADFVTMQGNHVILAVPHNGGYKWLECTSQVLPFGFQGDFTDDRMVLVVKPEGGEIVRTHVYDVQESSQVCKGNYTVTETGAISGKLTIASRGIQYDNKYFLESRSKDDLDKMYKEVLGNINSLKVKKATMVNDKESQQFTEDLVIEAEGYGNKSGDRMIFAVNAFNQSSNVPQRYRDRKSPFEISRGFYDTDEVTIDLPAGFTVEAKPENLSIKDKFGEYKAEYEMVTENKMIFKRTLLVNQGYYDSKDYENYRLFREKVAKNDNAKLVLVKK